MLYDQSQYHQNKYFVLGLLCKIVDVFDYFEIINKYVSGNIKNMNEEKLHELLKKHNVEIDKNSSYGKLLDKVFSVLVEPELIKPTFMANKLNTHSTN